jgi:membrane fusion protein, copper/silver efflux system
MPLSKESFCRLWLINPSDRPKLPHIMPTKITITTALVAAVLGLLLGRWLGGTAGHQHDNQVPAADRDEASSLTAANEVWTCSMHPQIQQPDPGQCPICGMDLILADTGDASSDSGPRSMTMSESALGLAEIETQRVERSFPQVSVRLVGEIDYDETRVRSLTARFPARIDELFVNYTGVTVSRGEHLAQIYSPELITAQRELLSAHTNSPQSEFVSLAREKLRLWDLLPEQIDAIVERGTVSDSFELRAPIGGVVMTKKISEGDYVSTGQAMFRIADLSELWLHLEAFESDLAKLRFGQEVRFTVESWPGEEFRGRIAFISPEVDARTRTIPIRVNVPNVDGRLKPGMFARGRIEVKLAGDNRVFAPDLAGKWISPMHPEIIKDGPGGCDICGMDLVPAESLGYVVSETDAPPLIVPSSAVLRTGKRAVVYVKKPNTDSPTFEGREVTLGSNVDDAVIVVDGLSEGEEIVTNGAFKIDSSLQIRAKPSMMNPTGGGPVPGHNHGDTAMNQASANDPHSAHQGMTSITIAETQIASILPGYLSMQEALAADDLTATKEAARATMQVMGHVGEVPDLLHAVLTAETLESVRSPHFEKLSRALIAAMRSSPPDIASDLYVMHCPMAVGGNGADWVQSDEALRNPYFGAMMLKCGEIVERITLTTDGEDNHAH